VSPGPHVLFMVLVSLQALLNLLLTGRASPHVFNGTLQFGEDGQPLEHPLQGVLSRSDVGYLHWSREQMDRGGLPQVGSMLKTPRFPVWVCCINSSYSVLFSLNRSLLSDWRMEHQFKLFYFNGQNCQRATAQLTVGYYFFILRFQFKVSGTKRTISAHEGTINLKPDEEHPPYQLLMEQLWVQKLKTKGPKGSRTKEAHGPNVSGTQRPGCSKCWGPKSSTSQTPKGPKPHKAQGP
ncbi:hypothetical protein XENOCAPTIV_020100, partial [Xenoophorus captivus]